MNNADLPLPELSIDANELTYKGKKWDSMSGSDQLRVSTAIVRKLNPDCGFVLLDKLEQMDLKTLQSSMHGLNKKDCKLLLQEFLLVMNVQLLSKMDMLKKMLNQQ